MQKGALPFKDTPLAPKDETWDGGAEVKAATVDDLKIMCAYVDPDNADIKTGYKLPHHKADGDHAVVWRGVANAMARLNQTQMPDSDKKAVYNHLAKHYKQFDETPPDLKSFDDEKLHVTATYDPETKLAIASTDVIDRHGESINQDGWDLKGYQANPVLLWAHDNYEPAIGQGLNTKIVQMGDKRALTFTPTFHGKTDLSAAMKVLYQGDETTQPVLNSFSVGFRPTEMMEGDSYPASELLEISCVNVPANPDAQMLAYKTLTDKGFERKTIEEIGISAEVLDKIAKLEKDVQDLQSLAKGNIPSAPKAKVLSKRQMLAKAITRAADLLGEGNKNKTLSADQNEKLVKIIKRAGDKLTASQKEEIRNG